jgi:hypothetical protein
MLILTGAFKRVLDSVTENATSNAIAQIVVPIAVSFIGTFLPAKGKHKERRPRM